MQLETTRTVILFPTVSVLWSDSRLWGKKVYFSLKMFSLSNSSWNISKCLQVQKHFFQSQEKEEDFPRIPDLFIFLHLYIIKNLFCNLNFPIKIDTLLRPNNFNPWCPRNLSSFFVITTTQLGSHSTAPHPVHRARRWYTVVTLLYDWPCQWEGWEHLQNHALGRNALLWSKTLSVKVGLKRQCM